MCCAGIRILPTFAIIGVPFFALALLELALTLASGPFKKTARWLHPRLHPSRESIGAADSEPVLKCFYFNPLSLPYAKRARLRIMDSKDTRGTSINFRISALRSNRCVPLGMREAARSNALDEAAYMPAMAR